MRGEPGGGHIDIAQEVLAQQGIEPVDRLDHYEQMFRLKYARIVEHDRQLLEVEFRSKLTAAQQRFVEDMQSQGWTIRLERRG